jgi:hypothetical protein
MTLWERLKWVFVTHPDALKTPPGWHFKKALLVWVAIGRCPF